MSQRLTITVSETCYVRLLAISRVEHRRPAAMVRVLLEDAMKAGLQPTQKLLLEEEYSADGRPVLRLIRGGSEQ